MKPLLNALILKPATPEKPTTPITKPLVNPETISLNSDVPAVGGKLRTLDAPKISVELNNK